VLKKRDLTGQFLYNFVDPDYKELAVKRMKQVWEEKNSQKYRAKTNMPERENDFC
jgi:hypothetical protein